jgi:sugar phosphate isomerase/epimerase
MELIFFTKFLKGLGPSEIAETVRGLKFDGLDLAIRQGHFVNPSNVQESLPKAMETWRQSRLSVPMVSLETDSVDPKSSQVESIFEACGAEGIPSIKLGYWNWKPGQRYLDGVETIREALSEFQKLGEKYRVRSLVHTHSGSCYGLNASAAMQLVSGFDPQYVGVYLDPAHLAVSGENLPMALDIVGEHLKMVGVKNVRYQGSDAKDGPRWKRQWCLLSEGLVNWPEALRLLSESGYDGPLSVHGEYSASQERSEVLKLVAQDMEYLRSRAG